MKIYKESPKKLKYIDSLRALAILGVIFIHAGDTINDAVYLPGIWRPLISSGQYGVQLFFVVSAYTIFLSLNEREKTKCFSVNAFYVRRFFRIAPMYYIGILYYTFERFIGFDYLFTGTYDLPIPRDALIANIFFVHGLHPDWINGYVPGGWSIAVEILFYLVVPYLFKKIKTLDQSIVLLFVSIIISIIFNSCLQNNLYLNRAYFLYCSFPNQLPVFAIGISAYFLVTEKNTVITLRSYLMLLLIVAFLFNYPFSKHIIFSIGAALLLVLLSKKENSVFVNRVTIYIGKISFSMYVVHFAIITILTKYGFINLFEEDSANDILINLILRFFLVTLISVAVASVCYYIVELPFQRLGKYVVKLNRKKEIFSFYKSHSL